MANPCPSPLPPAQDSVGSGRWQPVTVMDPGSGPGKTQVGQGLLHKADGPLSSAEKVASSLATVMRLQEAEQGCLV